MIADRRMLLGAGSGMMAGAFWGLVFLAPELTHGFSPLQLSASRYLAYGAIAVLLVAPRWRQLSRLIGRAEWIGLAWLSFLGNIAYYVLLAGAVRMAGIAATSLIIGFLPVVVTLVGSRDDGALSLRALLPSLLLAVTGIGLIGIQSLGTDAQSADVWHRAVGLLCAFGALAAWSAYAVGNSRWLARLPQLSAHDWSLLTGVVTGMQAVLIAVPAFVGDSAMHSDGDWLRFWSVSGGVAIAASILGNGLWNRASRLLPLTMIGQMIIFETLFALLYGFLWEQRLPTALEGGAVVLLVASVLWCASSHAGYAKTADA